MIKSHKTRIIQPDNSDKQHSMDTETVLKVNKQVHESLGIGQHISLIIIDRMK